MQHYTREAGIKDVKTALELIAAFYPAARIPAKVAFGVEEIMERLAKKDKQSSSFFGVNAT